MSSRPSHTARSETLGAYAFCGPLLLVALLFVALPVGAALWTSACRDVTFLPWRFCGLDNYARLLADLHFWQALRFTSLFAASSVGLELVVGLVLALTVHQAFPGRGLARTAVLLPWAIPVAVSARVWQLIYSVDHGPLNALLLQVGLVGRPIHWLGSPAGAFAALVASDVWKTAPFVAIILLAGLAAIPRDLYRQARVDGTHFGQRFVRITLPLLKGPIVVALLFRIIDAVRIFDLVYVLTGGGPGGSTTSLSLYAYRLYLSGDFGGGSAVSVVVFVLAALLATITIRAGRFTEVLR